MQTAPQVEPESTQEAPYFYAVGTQKFVTLWLGSLGFYGLYWFHKHWQVIRDREQAAFKPWHRMLGAGSWCEPLLLQFQQAADGAKPYRPRLRAVLWLALTATLLLGPPLSLLCPLAFLPLIAGQRLANQVTAARTPRADANTRMQGAEWLTLLPLLAGLAVGAAVLAGKLPKP